MVYLSDIVVILSGTGRALILLSGVNRVGVGRGLGSDGDLHGADYLRIIHSE